MPDNQLAMGIQSKSVRGPGAELPVGGVGSNVSFKSGGLGGPSLPKINKNVNFFFPSCFARNLMAFLRKKNVFEKIFRHFFSEFFFSFSQNLLKQILI